MGALDVVGGQGHWGGIQGGNGDLGSHGGTGGSGSSPEHSHSPFLDGGIIFPPLSGMLDPCQFSSNN